MTIALIVLLAVVAFGRGGYAPWATLVLEAGASAAVAYLAFTTLWGSTDALVKRRRAWKKIPFHVRHPGLGRWLSRRRSQRAEIEILLPGDADDEAVELDVGRNLYPMGVALKRTGLGAPLLLLTLWIVIAVVPIRLTMLELVSPEAYRFRAEAASLLGAPTQGTAVWSLAPFLTLRSFWLWLSVLGVFAVSCVSCRRRDTAAKMAFLLLLLGAVSGVAGMTEWFTGLSALLGRDASSLRASGTFGNPNHFAAFQGMLLAVSLGWLAYFRERHTSRPSRARQRADASGLGAIAALGVLLLGLGLVMSLSRSGMAFALVGCAVFVALTRRVGDRRPMWALGLVAGGLIVWIGLEPLVGRFQDLGDQWILEQGRTAVWRDSAPAIGDFWLTGSGLSSFRYVGAVYRTFGGQIFFSWAHNDYLQLAIELGLPGILLLVWIGVAIFRAAKRVREDLVHDPALLQLHSGFVAAVTAIALHSFTDFSLHIPANLALLAILTGVVVGMEGSEARFDYRGVE